MGYLHVTALFARTVDRARGAPPDTDQLVLWMTQALALRDPYTAAHCRRVARLSAAILRELDCGPREARLILAAARIHDVGKIALPDYILNKPAPLTAPEQMLAQTHAEGGARLVLAGSACDPLAAVVRHHHERWDGSGYPYGLQGRAIPLGARVIAVADSFDAMTTTRPYRRALPRPVALAILRGDQGRQWDGRVVEAFLAGLA